MTSGAQAIFKNSGKDPSLSTAELYFEEQFWGKLGHGDPAISVNTFSGHLWRVVVEGKEVRRWTIDKNEGSLAFVI